MTGPALHSASSPLGKIRWDTENYDYRRKGIYFSQERRMEGEVGENQGTRFKNCVCYTVLLCLYTVLLMLVPRVKFGTSVP